MSARLPFVLRRLARPQHPGSPRRLPSLCR
ncbi:TPA: methylenetetrahydrofolate dehydrogenase (NADP+ dependent) 1-like precursor, partial [Bos taurus]